MLQSVQISSNELEIFKLRFIVFTQFALAYLSYIYFMQEFSAYFFDRVKRLNSFLRDKIEFETKIERVGAEEFHEMEYVAKFNEEEKTRLMRVSMFSKLGLDYFPVFALISLAFTGIHEEMLGTYLISAAEISCYFYP